MGDTLAMGEWENEQRLRQVATPSELAAETAALRRQNENCRNPHAWPCRWCCL